MAERPRFIDDLAGVAGGAFSALAGLREEAESIVRARVEEAIRKLDLVRRDDMDAALEMAANARAGQEAADRRIAALEARLDAHMASVSGVAEAPSDVPGASEADPASLPPTPRSHARDGGTSEAAPGTMPPGGGPGSPDGMP